MPIFHEVTLILFNDIVVQNYWKMQKRGEKKQLSLNGHLS